MKKSILLSAALTALALSACGESAEPVNEATDAVDQAATVTSEAAEWRNLPHADLITGDLQYREDVRNFIIPESRFSEIEHVDDGIIVARGETGRKLATAKSADIIWFGNDTMRSVTEVEETVAGVRVTTVDFWLFDYVWGEFDVDLGEMYTRMRFQELGLWTPEGGWVAPRDELVDMPYPELVGLSRALETNDYREFVSARTGSVNGPTLTVSHPELKYRDPNGSGESIELKVTGEIKFPMSVEGIIRLRVVRCSGGIQVCRDDSNWVQRKTSISASVDSESSDGKYENCAIDRFRNDDRAITTCLDQMLVKFEPGMDPSLKAEVIANMEGFFAWRVGEDDDNTEVASVDLPDVPLGPYLKLSPSLFVDVIASVGVGTTITFTGEINGALRAPLGVEIFGSERAALDLCGGCVGNAQTCGCNGGFNPLPNRRHPETKTLNFTAGVSIESGKITAKAGLQAGIALGVAPSIGLVVIEGIKAGLRLVGEGKYVAVRAATSGGEPCLKLEGKLIPFGELDPTIILDIGEGVELADFGAVGVDFAEYSLGKYENNDVCVDLAPRNSIKLTVQGDVQAGGVNDLNGFEVDSVFMVREGNVTYANGESEPDGTCNNVTWNGVTTFTGSKTYTFSENLLPGDVITIVRVTEKTGECNPSGTATVEIGPNDLSSNVGNQNLTWSHTVTAADLL